MKKVSDHLSVLFQSVWPHTPLCWKFEPFTINAFGIIERPYFSFKRIICNCFSLTTLGKTRLFPGNYWFYRKFHQFRSLHTASKICPKLTLKIAGTCLFKVKIGAFWVIWTANWKMSIQTNNHGHKIMKHLKTLVWVPFATSKLVLDI